jgi:aldose sugar dehydrogenase
MIYRIFVLSILFLILNPATYCMLQAVASRGEDGPLVHDRNLRIEMISEGLEYPTDMDFLGRNDILIIEKDRGTVQRIVNGEKLNQPILDVTVSNQNERGMLGMAVSTPEGKSPNVYLYFTESPGEEDGTDYCPKIIYCEGGNNPKGNRLYKYEFISDRLVNPELLLDLPAAPGSDHNGGSLVIGPDNNLYLVIGDLSFTNSQVSNIDKGTQADGRSGILRVTQEGKVVLPPLFRGEHPLDMYYAYGIRNSFGIDFDPLTGHLWDTENGPDYGDEINLVEPGFNSGWKKIQGVLEQGKHSEEPGRQEILDDFVDFDGEGKYSDPEFTWRLPVGLTSIKFLASDKLGEEYENDLLVADIHNGNIYRFELNDQRTELVLDGALDDRVADTAEEYEETLFASGFNGITDIEVGPDGYLYVLAFHERTKADRTHYYGQGELYRIVPAAEED